MVTRTEVALEKLDLAIGELSNPIGPDARRHGWTDELKGIALDVLVSWRTDLATNGVVAPDHEMAWSFWFPDVGLPGTKTYDERDEWVALIKDVDAYVGRWMPGS